MGGTRSHARILVVDDEESICNLLVRTLAPLGYEIETALDADSALEIMRTRPANVALCDIRMPGRDGAWLIERLQEMYPETAIVIVTGIRELDPRLTLGQGVVGYLTKPFSATKVRDIVKQAVAAVDSLPPRPPLRLLPGSDSQDAIVDLPEIDDDKTRKSKAAGSSEPT